MGTRPTDPMTWICDIPGATPAVTAWHLALELGLAAFVVIGGLTFLALGWRAYRRAERPSRG